MSKKIGNRAVVVVGSIVMSLGFFVSFFAMNVYYLVVTVGVVAGMCFLKTNSCIIFIYWNNAFCIDNTSICAYLCSYF